MLRISSILSKLENVKGGINTALLTLNISDRQELENLAPEVTTIKKRWYWKNKIVKEKSSDALIEDYNNEIKEYYKLHNKYAEERKNKPPKIELTYHEMLTQVIDDVIKYGYDINTITLNDTVYIDFARSKSVAWQSLYDLAGSMQDKIKRMVIKGFIKRSSRDNYIANKKWLQFYAG